CEQAVGILFDLTRADFDLESLESRFDRRARRLDRFPDRSIADRGVHRYPLGMTGTEMAMERNVGGARARITERERETVTRGGRVFEFGERHRPAFLARVAGAFEGALAGIDRFRPTGKRRGLADAPRSLVFDFDDEPL